ncbi:MAG TPA: Gfo/Idh/MocA family oxidoreductase [Polyangiaceae bacterium]|nr:Gfo/Idh/MocA family oxidoreductase [Polyangiaceae bacterium]
MPAQQERVRYAVVGAGRVAQASVLPAFANTRDDAELCAIVSNERDKREALAIRYGVTYTGSYDAYEEVLAASNADAVYIALPNALHREYTERAAEAGVHVLCEKPMAMTEDDCHAMIRAADKRGVFLMIAYRLHFEEANLTAIEIGRSGNIGEPRVVTAVHTQSLARPNDIRTKRSLGGGALFDLGPYCVNAARYLLRAEPVEVTAWQATGTSEASCEVDETTSAMLRFHDGRIATFTVSQAAARSSSLRVIGTLGSLRVEPAFLHQGALEHYLTVGETTEHRVFRQRDQFAAEIAYFSKCIRRMLEPEPSGWEGLADVRVLVAIQNAARSGIPTELSPFERTQRPDLRQNIELPPSSTPKVIEAPTLSL